MATKARKPAPEFLDTAEQKRLNDAREKKIPWKKWGPYLSERQWGTVRETTARTETPGTIFRTTSPLARLPVGGGRDRGALDEKQRLCFALALWNERDSILKERLFGLTTARGTNGEDVKEYYFYVDSTPTHSYIIPSTSTRRGSSRTGTSSRRTGRGRGRRWSTSCSTPASSMRTGTSTSSWNTPRKAPRHPDSRHGPQPWAGGGPAAPSSDTLVPEHLVLGRGGS